MRYYFILLLFTLLIVPAGADDFPIRFERISVEEGLSQSTALSVFRDSKGFIWIGTFEGLNRYDGYTCKTFRSIPGDSTSLSSSSIMFIHESPADSGRKLWIGTADEGLNEFDRDSEKFTRFSFRVGKDSLNPGINAFRNMAVDKNNNIWMVTSGAGVIKFNPADYSYKLYRHNHTDPSSISNNVCESIAIDDAGLIWIGTLGTGLDCLDPVAEKFYNFRHDPDDPKSLNNDFISDLYYDGNGFLFIGTRNGLHLLDLKSVQRKIFAEKKPDLSLKKYLHRIGDPTSISGNWISSALRDRQGNYWIGTYGGGINFFNPVKNEFQRYLSDDKDPNSISNNDILTLYQDPIQDIIWICTDGGGVNKLSRNKPFHSFAEKITDSNGSQVKTIYSICEDQSGNIYLGSQSNGLYVMDPEEDTYVHFVNDPYDDTSLGQNGILSLAEDKYHRIWIGTQTGLCRYEQEGNNFRNFRHKIAEESDFKGNRVSALIDDPRPENHFLWLGTMGNGLVLFDYEQNVFLDFSRIPQLNQMGVITYFLHDKYQNKEILWIGTLGNGLIRLDLNSYEFRQFLNDPSDDTTISSNSIYVIYRDHNSVLWIGSRDGGLIRYNDESENFTHISEHYAIPSSSSIMSMIEDHDGNLWLGMLGGLCKFNYQSGTYSVYDRIDGLPFNEFWPGHIKSTSGRFYFAGNEGLVAFYPDQIKNNDFIPQIVFTDFQVFNKQVPIGKDSPLTRSIVCAPDIFLQYDQDIFSISFSALDYYAPSKNKFAYKMDGVNPDWVSTDAKHREATYTKLPIGQYRFCVKGSNSDGIWNETSAVLNITVLPPWWRSDFAYAIFVMIIAGIVLVIWRIYINRLKLLHKLEMEQFQTEKFKEIDQTKSRFFTNISHEFRTPLTLIESPVRQFINGTLEGNIKDHFKVVLKNTKRLLDLVNQLLEISRLESGSVKLKIVRYRFFPLLKGLVQSFADLADSHQIKLQIDVPEKQWDLYLDREKFEKIINNIILNAINYTPEGGTVKVRLNECTGNFSRHVQAAHIRNFICITVSNTGPGIPAEHLPHLFERFYRADESSGARSGTHGIGLSVVKELVEMHFGSITVNSKPGEWTSFQIYLPLGNEHLLPEQIAESNDIPDHEILPGHDDTRPVFSDESPRCTKTATILVVEDHQDVLEYIYSILSPAYKIIPANNGHDGLNQIYAHDPDLIISDVIMPGMNGYEMCRLIKENVEISHIPIILLTARASQEEKYTGLDCGADDYITKPFDARELQLRVQNILNQRQRIHDKFRHLVEINPREFNMTPIDERFFGKVSEIVNAKDGPIEITIPEIARSLGISRSTLSRKIKALLDLTPSEFIRTMRLKRARKLIQTGNANVSEIAYEVGFNSLSYFTKSYKSHYGITPSQERSLQND